MLSKDPELSLRRLAEREGQVPATLVHHFKLLKLASEIQHFLARLRERKAIHFFSLRRLMPLANLNDGDQRRIFRRLQLEFVPLAARYPEHAWELVLGYDQQRIFSERAGAAVAAAARESDRAARANDRCIESAVA